MYDSIVRHRVHNAVTDMTDISGPRPVHEGRGSDLGNEERVSLPRCTLLSFQRPLTSPLKLET